MKCEICGARKAVIHIRQVIGKEWVDLHLCEECALERGISGEGEHVELSISNMLKKFGCAECYSTFSREIHFLLEKMGAQSTHRGKLPRGLSTYKRYLVDVVKLKEGLKQALKREDYEKAARIRDRIRELENASEEL